MRVRAVLRAAFPRCWYAAFLGYLLASVLIVTVWIETAVDAAFWWGARWLFGPWLAALYAGWWLLDADFARNARRWGAHVVLLAWAGVLAVGSGGYVALANHLIGPHPGVVAQGTVERLGRLRGRYGPTEYVVTLRRPDGTTVRLYVPRALHERLRVGQPYRHRMLRGGPGLPYRLH